MEKHILPAADSAHGTEKFRNPGETRSAFGIQVTSCVVSGR
ncbi:hypothetical protein [Paenibacillus shenyangensis]|nr:hypothetical protein [Paenibacillus sp. A9]